jgi:hypothetical protein
VVGADLCGEGLVGIIIHQKRKKQTSTEERKKEGNAFPVLPT